MRSVYRHGDVVKARDVRVGVDGHQNVGHVSVNDVCLESPATTGLQERFLDEDSIATRFANAGEGNDEVSFDLCHA